MADAPSPPWTYPCPHCSWHIIVNARGAHGRDPGSGVEAHRMMQAHIETHHAAAVRQEGT
jgi:hypothetical protein